ncbi:hypothetical protein Micbo1qcDRAFT_52232 [Microdochium bolleyi]|uniref:Ubiquitin-like protease family profile domain-containing protein n=1 Tax=Microdochium bolleyi TaxID=196109 RepID=A0A136J712_9PEZI|nr:hypothetical protein Micbo1qcDRAFT_52232 [Microdochium bolleyi]
MVLRTQETVSAEHLDKLGKKLDRKWSEAQEQQNQQNQAARKNPKPDDVALIEHNLARQSKVTAKPIEADVEKRPKLKDTMSTVGEEIASADPYDVSSTLQSSPRRTTRTTRAMFVPREPSPILPCAPSWTSQNPDWSDRWRNSVLYPAVGKDRAVVDKVDIERLDEGEFLNDNLIIFYLRYLQLNQEARNKDLAERIHFHNTFFFEKLKPTKSGAGINYDSVKGWTAKVDLFSKDFIVVPINEHSHWYVAIICNAPKLLKAEVPEDAAAAKAEESQEIGAEKPPREAVPGANPPSPNDRVVSDLPHRAEAELAADMSRVRVRSPTTGPGVTDDGFRTQPVVTSASSRKKSGKRKSTGFIRDPTQLRIITLDSLSSPHSPACGYLKQYLLAELKDKKNMVVADPGKVGLTARQLPVQQNFCDCGLYLLGYVKKFLEDPDAFVRSIMGQGDIVWDLDPSALRNEIRELLLKLQDEQQKQEDDEAERKRRKREASKAKHEQAMGNSKSHSPVATDKVSDSSGLESASNPGEPPAPAIQASGKAVDTSQILRSTEAVSPEPCGLHHLNHERAVILDSQESVQEIPPMPLQKNRALSADREGQFVNTEEAFVDVLPDSPTESTTPSPKNKRKVSPDVQKQSYSATTGTTNGASEEPKRQKRIEVSLPRAPGAFEMQSTELRSKRSSDRHKNEEASRYFAGKRTGDRTGTARLRQVASNKAQQSDVIELGSDSE